MAWAKAASLSSRSPMVPVPRRESRRNPDRALQSRRRDLRHPRNMYARARASVRRLDRGRQDRMPAASGTVRYPQRKGVVLAGHRGSADLSPSGSKATIFLSTWTGRRQRLRRKARPPIRRSRTNDPLGRCTNRVVIVGAGQAAAAAIRALRATASTAASIWSATSRICPMKGRRCRRSMLLGKAEA